MSQHHDVRHRHASSPPTAAQWQRAACSLYLEPLPHMARPRVPSDWPPQSLQRSRRKQDACASIPNRGRLWQGRGSRYPRVVDRPPKARPEVCKGAPRQCSPLSQQGSRPVQEHLDSCRNQADSHRLSPRPLLAHFPQCETHDLMLRAPMR